MRKNLLLCSVFVSLLSGCFFRAPVRGAPPPPPRAMSYGEAVDRGYGECRSRGLDCRLKEAHLSRGNSVWKVKMRAYAPARKGHLHLEYDAYSHALIRVDSKVKPWKRSNGPRFEDDRDWDDDYDGRDPHPSGWPGNAGPQSPGNSGGHSASPPSGGHGGDKDDKEDAKDARRDAKKDAKDDDDDDDDHGRKRRGGKDRERD